MLDSTWSLLLSSMFHDSAFEGVTKLTQNKNLNATEATLLIDLI